jgi:hypothetical protein
VLEVLFGAEGLGLEACHLTGGGCRLILGPATDHDPQRGIAAESLGIIDILVAGQPTVERLAQESQEAVLGVLPSARVVQAGRRGAGQCEGVIEFPGVRRR